MKNSVRCNDEHRKWQITCVLVAIDWQLLRGQHFYWLVTRLVAQPALTLALLRHSVRAQSDTPALRSVHSLWLSMTLSDTQLPIRGRLWPFTWREVSLVLWAIRGLYSSASTTVQHWLRATHSKPKELWVLSNEFFGCISNTFSAKVIKRIAINENTFKSSNKQNLYY